MRIRPAVRADVPLILAFIRELAEYERALEEVHATEDDLLRDGFGDRPAFHVLVAEAEGGSGDPASMIPAGFALYFFTYSTWKGRRVLSLEDLFVRPALRGRGVGLALMRALAAVAVENDCARFQWQVLDWNQPAIDFYERFGATILPDWQTVRVDGETLRRIGTGRVADT